MSRTVIAILICHHHKFIDLNRRMMSPGMLRRVAVVSSGGSEGFIASFFGLEGSV
jgi:hypothetical protein